MIKFLDTEKLKALFQKIGKKFPNIHLVYLFGSHANAKPTPLSDIDIALVVEEKNLKKSKWDLEIEVEEALEKEFTNSEFDVKIVNASPIDFQGKIITEGRLLYAKEDILRADYEEKTRKYYFDFKPFIDHYCRERLQTIRQKGLTHG